MILTLGSLFDGSGGFPLAGAMHGITPVWASEIEPYPIAVTRARFPCMEHLGSVTEIDGGKIRPVDVITFGSPCQDMSVAGKRAGMKHESRGDNETTRSGLFMEAVRIIREMREATHDQYPRFAVWENVPGAFSSNRGEDFRCVLEEFVRLCGWEGTVSLPQSGKWRPAGEVLGDDFSIAWRVLDAQYWGVPQRRKRIYLVADFTGRRAGEILFEREGVPGHPAQGGEAREETTADSGGCAEGSGGVIYALHDKATRHQGGGETRRDDGSGAVGGGSPTLKSSPSGLNLAPSVVYPRIARTITAEADASPCVDRGQNVVCINPACYDARGNGDGCIVSTVTGDHENRVTDYTALVVRCQTMSVYTIDRTTSTIKARDYKGGAIDAVVENNPKRKCVRRLTPLECCRLQGFPDGWGVLEEKDSLTDEEYAFWTEVRMTHAIISGKKFAERTYSRAQMLKWYNGLHTDSAEYKMWGNGIALPCAEYVMQGISEC